jgi:hypothetical protein
MVNKMASPEGSNSDRKRPRDITPDAPSSPRDITPVPSDAITTKSHENTTKNSENTTINPEDTVPVIKNSDDIVSETKNPEINEFSIESEDAKTDSVVSATISGSILSSIIDGNTILDFGEFEGRKIRDVPDHYLRFLSLRKIGLKCTPIYDVLDDEVNGILSNRGSIQKCTAPHPCIRSIIKDTAEDTKEALLAKCLSLEDVIIDSEDNRDCSLYRLVGKCKNYARIWIHKKNIVEKARNYMDGERICWRCARPIGRNIPKDEHNQASTVFDRECWETMPRRSL